MLSLKQRVKESTLPGSIESDSVQDTEYIPVLHTRNHILIVYDIETNHEIMGELLADDYDISYAADGVETLEVLCSHKGEINLFLLDLQMPNPVASVAEKAEIPFCCTACIRTTMNN